MHARSAFPILLAIACAPRVVTVHQFAPPVAPAVEHRVSVPLAQFPDSAQVEAVIAASPAPDLHALLTGPQLFVDHWDIETPPAPGDAQYEAQGTLEAAIDAAATRRSVAITRSASLRCAAQELARFQATHSVSASDPLVRHLLAVCGASATTVARAFRSGRIPTSLSPDRTLATLVDGSADLIEQAIADGGQVGAAFARAGAHAAIVIVSGRPDVRIDQVEPPSADGLAIVRGRVEVPSDALVAFINQGPTGVAACRVTPGIGLPQFELRCPMEPSDDTAIVRIQSLRMGRVLSEAIGRVLVRRTPDARPPYQVAALGEPAIVESQDAVGPALVERLNAVRTSLGLSPVALSAEQSALHQRAAPIFVGGSAAQHTPPEVLGLDLMAGHGITGGTIRDGDLCGALLVGTRDVSRLLAVLLLEPVERHLLLRPDARQIAVGALALTDPDALGVVVSTYAFFEDVDHARDADAIFDRVAAVRAEHGLPPPQRLADLSALDAQARAVAQGADPYQALMAGLNAEATRYRGRFSGGVQETVFLQLWPVPQEMLRSPILAVGAAVTHTHAPGGAWGQYVVAFLYGEP